MTSPICQVVRATQMGLRSSAQTLSFEKIWVLEGALGHSRHLKSMSF